MLEEQWWKLSVPFDADGADAHSLGRSFLLGAKCTITAVGIDNAAFLESLSGVRFVQVSELQLPFRDRAFDVVHSSTANMSVRYKIRSPSCKKAAVLHANVQSTVRVVRRALTMYIAAIKLSFSFSESYSDVIE